MKHVRKSLAPVVAAAVVDSGAVEAVAQAASGTAGKSYRSERIQEGVP
jgi:hypothetical protein